MNSRAVLVLLLLVCRLVSTAQPLSGNYTVGGIAPDFPSLQDAANAIKHRGVSGPVFINIRPGTYIRATVGSLMVIDSIVSGSSPTNRITFQPDVESGGNPSNVILLARFNGGVASGDREIFFIETDYVTLRNLTFMDPDSLGTPASFLVRVAGTPWDPTIEGFAVEGCTFIGTPYYLQGQQFGTDYGIYSSNLATVSVTNNRFSNLMRAIGLDVETGGVGGQSAVIEDNRFDHLFGGSTGSGNPLGSAIEVELPDVLVRWNFVSQSSGARAISVAYPVTATVEANYVRGSYLTEMEFGLNSAGQDRTDSIIVLNNVLIGPGTSATLSIQTRNTRIFHNTIMNTGGNNGLWVTGDQCTVLNNILTVSSNTIIAYNISGASGIVSDHNVFFKGPGQWFFAQSVAGTLFTTFEGYRTGTGLDSNSAFTSVDFESDSLGIHLDECEAQNPALQGIPLPRVPTDFYGAQRDSLKPFVGAVEGVRLPYDMFAAPYKSILPGFPVSIAKGAFDNSTAPGLVVSDWDNRQVVLFHNNGAARSFFPSGAIFTGFRPTDLKLYDLDGDSHLDLIVAGDTAAASLKVFWGDGNGGFSPPTTVDTWGRVKSVRPGPRYASASTLVTVENSGSHSAIGYVMNTPGRQLCHDMQYTGSNLHVDTLLNSTLLDFSLASLEPNQTVMSLVAPGLFGSTSVIPKLFVFNILAIGDVGAHCTQASIRFVSGDSALTFPVAPYMNSAAIVAGDFDGDGDNDFVTTGFSDEFCVFLRNQGSLSFAVDTIPASASRGIVAFDYEHDGDLDFFAVNRTLDSLGITVFLNDGAGHFSERRNCHFPFASGWPDGVVADDFDLDGRTDIAVVSRTLGGFDSLFVLYNLGGFNSTTTVHQQPSPTETPQGFALLQNYPNPFNPSTRIEYALPVESNVSIRIYNMLGQEVVALLDEKEFAGHHSIEWNGRSANGIAVSSGVYFYRLEVTPRDGSSRLANVKKMVLLK